MGDGVDGRDLGTELFFRGWELMQTILRSSVKISTLVITFRRVLDCSTARRRTASHDSKTSQTPISSIQLGDHRI